MLSRQFPHDPEILYILTHAYSDLATRAATELATTAPTSIPALEMDADASEPQGKWDQAESDYRKILEQNPRYPGIHFRLARLILSKPSPPPDFTEIVAGSGRHRFSCAYRPAAEDPVQVLAFGE